MNPYLSMFMRPKDPIDPTKRFTNQLKPISQLKRKKFDTKQHKDIYDVVGMLYKDGKKLTSKGKKGKKNKKKFLKAVKEYLINKYQEKNPFK